AGIDWATADHVACVVDMTGRVTDRFSAAHDKAGIAALITRLRRSKVTEVAIERGDGPLVDALLTAGLTVVVITSRQVKNLRSRFGAAAELDEQAIGAWLATIAVRGRPAPASVLHARLHAAPPGATGTDGAAQAGVTAALTATLTALSAQIKALATQIAGQLAAHPDGHIFTSLPRPGTVRAARLLAEIGDCRSRLPDAESLAGLAGVAPVTRRSGTRIAHGFRWAVNRQLRDAICDVAADSRHASPWAAAIYD